MLEHGWIGSTAPFDRDPAYVGSCNCCGRDIYDDEWYEKDNDDLYCEHCMYKEDE
jgi:hypothetical protein